MVPAPPPRPRDISPGRLARSRSLGGTAASRRRSLAARPTGRRRALGGRVPSRETPRAAGSSPKSAPTSRAATMSPGERIDTAPRSPTASGSTDRARSDAHRPAPPIGLSTSCTAPVRVSKHVRRRVAGQRTRAAAGIAVTVDECDGDGHAAAGLYDDGLRLVRSVRREHGRRRRVGDLERLLTEPGSEDGGSAAPVMTRTRAAAGYPVTIRRCRPGAR